MSQAPEGAAYGVIADIPRGIPSDRLTQGHIQALLAMKQISNHRFFQWRTSGTLKHSS
jgi:hypothetical protein